MPKLHQMIESKYLRKEDVEQDTTVTLGRVAQESMPNGEKRWVLAFAEFDKGLVLNTTTIRVLADSFGHDSDDWLHKRAVLYVDPNVSFKGQVVGGLRLRPIRGSAPPPPARDALEDEITF